MTAQSSGHRPAPLGSGRLTARRINELVDARVLDIRGDGLIKVSRYGDRVTIGLALDDLLRRIAKPPRAMRGVIKSFSAATGTPSDITYSIGFHHTCGDPTLTFTDRTPWLRMVESTAAEIIAADIGSACLVWPGRDENDKPTLELIACNERLLLEDCETTVTASLLPIALEAILFGVDGELLRQSTGAVLVDENITEPDETTAYEAALIDAYGRQLLDASGRWLYGEPGSEVSEQYGDALERVLTDAFGRTMRGVDGAALWGSGGD